MYKGPTRNLLIKFFLKIPTQEEKQIMAPCQKLMSTYYTRWGYDFFYSVFLINVVKGQTLCGSLCLPSIYLYIFPYLFRENHCYTNINDLSMLRIERSCYLSSIYFLYKIQHCILHTQGL